MKMQVMRRIISLMIAIVALGMTVGSCGGGEKAVAVSDSLEIARALLGKIKWPVALPDYCRIDTAWISASDSTLNATLTLGEDYLDSASVAGDESIRRLLVGIMLQASAMATAIEAGRKVPLRIAMNVGDGGHGGFFCSSGHAVSRNGADGS